MDTSSSQEGHALEERARALVSTLPPASFLRNYAVYASQLTDCNAIYHLGAGLTLLSQTAPDDLHIRLGNKLFANLYVLIVGPSTSSRKTAAVKIAREVLDEALPGRACEAPGSYEGLVESLRAQPKQLIPYEEFGQFLSQAEKSYLTPIKTGLTSIYDGSPAGRVLAATKTKRALPPVQKPRLSLLCACAPGYLSRHTEPVDWTDGFFARFLTLAAPRAREYDLTPADQPEFRAWLVQRLRELAASTTTPGPCVGMTPAALGIWKRWSKERADLGHQSAKVAGAVGRAPAMALKIAMLLAWEDGAVTHEGWQLAESHIQPAIDLLGVHLSSVFSLGETLGGTAAMNDRQAVLAVIKDKPVTLGEIGKASYLLQRRVKEIVETLREEKMIDHVQMQEGIALYDAYVRARPKTEEDGPGGKVIQLRQSSSVVKSTLFPSDSPSSAASLYGGTGSNSGVDGNGGEDGEGSSSSGIDG